MCLLVGGKQKKVKNKKNKKQSVEEGKVNIACRLRHVCTV